MRRGEEVPEHTRQQVYERDLRRCRLCGKTNAYTYSVHHITYRSAGGTNDLDNLILLCGSGSSECHLKVHSDKGLYEPLLRELIGLTGVTGLALMRRRIRAATDDRPRGGRVQRSPRNGSISRFFGESERTVHSDSGGEPQP